jgi:hypothetical protein
MEILVMLGIGFFIWLISKDESDTYKYTNTRPPKESVNDLNLKIKCPRCEGIGLMSFSTILIEAPLRLISIWIFVLNYKKIRKTI